MEKVQKRKNVRIKYKRKKESRTKTKEINKEIVTAKDNVSQEINDSYSIILVGNVKRGQDGSHIKEYAVHVLQEREMSSR